MSQSVNQIRCERLPIELSLQAIRKRRSEQTGFVHHCYESEGEAHHTIPLYENFCAVLALFRSRMSEQVLEGKALLERLLPFEVEGNFPIYLHEYPQCKDRSLSIHLLPVFHWILTHFHSVLGEMLQQQLKALVERVVSHGQRIHAERPLPPSIFAKWQAYVDPQADFFFSPSHAEEWGELFVAWQMALSRGRLKLGEEEAFRQRWHPDLYTFLGPQKQEQTQPEVTLLDIGMGLAFQQFSDRVELDHPVHLQAALIHPLALKKTDPEQVVQILNPYTLIWGDASATHTLQFDPKKTATQVSPTLSGATFFSTLSEQIPQEGEDQNEMCFYFNCSPSHQLLINGQKGSTFQLGDFVSILSKEVRIDLIFSLAEGEGRFFGHVLKGNRPNQKRAKGNNRYAAYDWVLAVRTVGRTEKCALQVNLETVNRFSFS